METIIKIFMFLVVFEMLANMYYANKFHIHLIAKYPDFEKLTIFVGGVTGFRAIKNLLSDDEKSLNDQYLAKTKSKARFWLYAALITMLTLPILVSVISVIKILIDGK